jgi:CRISPR/Cas system-associated protein Cas10 (large subunit of type III CRISPR-Cas system)
MDCFCTNTGRVMCPATQRDDARAEIDRLRAALSAAEKEREGERACAICGKPGESSCTSPCGREGDIIKQLREWACKKAARAQVVADLTPEDAEFDWDEREAAEVALSAFTQVLTFLNDLQEQSTGEGK